MWMIATLLFVGLAAGFAASMFVRGDMHPTDWGVLLAVGVGGSLLGGIVINLLQGNGLKIQFSGVLASVIGAVALLALVTAGQNRGRQKAHSRSDGKRREPKGGRRHKTKKRR
jgi:uncharacterized membrane protein YeaQ/YmgE (transglycosylase-associated protein family)